MCKQLIDLGVPCLHFYTLNLEKSVLQILDGLSLSEGVQLRRSLPWRPSPATHRCKEDVRPIFWNNRPKSYLARTMSWDEFPNGRWGDSRSPAYGDLNDYHLMTLHFDKSIDLKSLWGQDPKSEQDIFDVFTKYVTGEIIRLPWTDNPLALESESIKDRLKLLNRNGFLTINSQPSVNGVPSDHSVHGWGGAGGFVYQKAYIEFFSSPTLLSKIADLIKLKYPTLTYLAVDVKGNFQSSYDLDHRITIAVTWGVFPGKEILQPTVVDTNSFFVWKDEAFALWNLWGNIYDEDSTSRNLIQKARDSYYLISIVDNNYITGNIWDIFMEIAREQELLIKP